MGEEDNGHDTLNDISRETNALPTEPSSTQVEADMAEETGSVTPARKATNAGAAPTILARGTWQETDERVRMSTPGHPQWVVTADRTYYPVKLVEDPRAERGIRGEILVHPGHVEELRATTDHQVLR